MGFLSIGRWDSRWKEHYLGVVTTFLPLALSYPNNAMLSKYINSKQNPGER